MSTARLAKAAIKIPTRIERGPTDILRALASTVKFIPEQPEFNLQEDPYLLPQRHIDNKIYLMSKLSGRKTAKFLLNKNPELFSRDDAEPKIEAFLPSEEFRMDMELNEKDIKWCIENNEVENAKIAYNSLVEKGASISDDLLMNLLEFFCFSNEENLLDSMSVEYERLSSDPKKQIVKMTWNTNGIASKIFNDVKERLDPARAYSAMIAGLSRANEFAACYQLFQDFKEFQPNQGLYPMAYEHLLKSGTRLNSSIETIHNYIDEITNHMGAHLVKPSLETFNAILMCYRSYNCDSDTVKKSCQLINDMRSLNIEPSLATFMQFTKIIARTGRSSKHQNLIFPILDHIEASPNLFVVRDSADILFFTTTMNIFATSLNNLGLSNRLYRLYNRNSNYFPTPGSKNRFLNEYFKLLITADSLEKILRFYRANVPMQMLPSPEAYDALADALDLYKADEETVRKIGQDLINFNMAKTLQNDQIFRKDPAYLKGLERLSERS